MSNLNITVAVEYEGETRASRVAIAEELFLRDPKALSEVAGQRIVYIIEAEGRGALGMPSSIEELDAELKALELKALWIEK